MIKPFPSHTIFKLDLPEFPNWWSDGRSHKLGEFDHEYSKAAVEKTAEGQLIVFLYVAGFGDLKVEMPLLTPRRLPLELFVRWDSHEVTLNQNGLGTTRVPWPSPPQAR